MRILYFTLTFALFLLLAQPVLADLKSDKKQIIQLLHRKYDKNALGQKVSFQIIGPYFSGNFALVTCVYGEGAGQSLLKKEKGKWVIISEGGGAFGEEGMIEYGKFPKKDAKEIMKQQEKAFKRK